MIKAKKTGIFSINPETISILLNELDRHVVNYILSSEKKLNRPKIVTEPVSISHRNQSEFRNTALNPVNVNRQQVTQSHFTRSGLPNNFRHNEAVLQRETHYNVRFDSLFF